MDPSARIINHMNKDHQLALIDYLVVYGNIKSSQLIGKSVKISKISEKSMSISYNLKNSHQDESILFQWDNLPEDENIKVIELKDLKSKLVSMAKYSASKQGYSHIQIKSYPKFTTPSFIIVAVGLILCAIGLYDIQLLKKLFENDPLTKIISPFFPQFFYSIFNYYANNPKKVFYTLLGVHSFEALFIMYPKTVKYRIPPLQSVAWVLHQFIGGFPTAKQFKKLIT